MPYVIFTVASSYDPTAQGASRGSLGLAVPKPGRVRSVPVTVVSSLGRSGETSEHFNFLKENQNYIFKMTVLMEI